MRPSVSSHGRLTPPSHLALGARIRGRATQAWGYLGTFKEGQQEATQAGVPVACLGMCWHLCCQQLAINWEPPSHVSSSSRCSTTHAHFLAPVLPLVTSHSGFSVHNEDFLCPSTHSWLTLCSPTVPRSEYVKHGGITWRDKVPLTATTTASFL